MTLQAAFLQSADLIRAVKLELLLTVTYSHTQLSIVDSSWSRIFQTRFFKAKAVRSLYSSQVIAGNLRSLITPGRRRGDPFGGIFSLPDMHSGTIEAFDSRASRNADPWKLPILLSVDLVPSGKKTTEIPSFNK
jgi:hypothetical protein